jgi:catecholate siderophore receptor
MPKALPPLPNQTHAITPTSTSALHNLLKPASIAAAMLMVGPVYAFDDAADAEAIVVTGHKEDTDLPTVRGPVIDIPQVVSIVGAETIKEQRIVSLEQALRNVAGVTTQVGEGGVVNGDQFFIRGQAAGNDVFTDGLRDFGQFTRDAFNYEQIEVLKGSSSTALGRGVAGGAINTTSKSPLSTEAFNIDLSAGTAKYRRFTVDANTPVTDNIALRLNFMAHSNDAVDRDVVNAKRWAFAPAIAFGLGTRTQLTAIYLHQEEDRIPDYGVPVALTTATDIERPVTEQGVKRSTFYGYAASDVDDVNVDTLTLKFAHDAGDYLKITSDTKLGSYKRFFRQSRADCVALVCGDRLTDNNPLTIPQVTIEVQRGGVDRSTRGVQNVSTLLYTQPLGSIRNELLIGWDVSYQTSDVTTFSNGLPALKDLFSPVNSGSSVLPGTIANTRKLRGTDLAAFIDDRIWFTDSLSLNLGLRYQNYVSRSQQRTFAATPTTVFSCNGVAQTGGQCFEERKSTNNIFSPKASIIWEPSEDISTYLSYSKSSVPQGNAIGNGDTLSSITLGGTISRSDLPPETTQTFDAGVKLALFGNRLLVQSSIYQITRNNATVADPVTGFNQYSAEPKQRLRGFELGLSGGITPDLRLSANYSFIDSEIREAFTGTTGTSAAVINTAAIGNQVRYVPRHAASLWTSYAPVDGSLKGLQIGGGLTYQSKVFLNPENTQIAPSYVAFDALIGYTIGNVRLAVNGYNLSNKLYYSQVNGGRVVPAAGRSFVASLGFAF